MILFPFFSLGYVSAMWWYCTVVKIRIKKVKKKKTQTVRARKPASFWREKRDAVIIFLRGFAKMLSCQNKFWHFSLSKRAQLRAIRITEQPILLTMSKVNPPRYKFSNFLLKTGTLIEYSFLSSSLNLKVPNIACEK